MRRSRLAVGAVTVVLVAVGIVVAVRVAGREVCGAEHVDAASPLQSPAKMAARPNEQRDALAAAVGTMAAPFGPVVAGVDFSYGQWLHLYGVTDGLLAWTKNNAPVTYLDGATLKPRWALEPTSSRVAWDASDGRFLLLDLEAKVPGTVSSYDLRSGEQEWCVSLSSRQEDGQPVATTFLDDGDVVTALPDGDHIRLTRLSGKDGEARWSDRYAAGRADFLGTMSDRLLVVGGEEEYRLAEAPTGEGTDTVAVLDVKTGARVWTWGASSGGTVHVVGAGNGRVLLTVRTTSGTDLVELGQSGTEVYRTRLAGGAHEVTLRGDVVLTRSSKALAAYDATTGEPRWSRDLPTNRTYFPYGFTLAQMPSTDADHVLLATTTSLDLLDLRTGRTVSYALPTDGVSTTYWPYQLLVTPRHLGVVANTGAILAARQ